MFRCPHCGQAKEMIFKPVNDRVFKLLQNDAMTETTFHVDREHIHPDHPNREVLIQEFKDVPADNPVYCPKCEENHSAEEWFDAKVNALKYFEMEDSQLCHCGGELWMDNIPGTSQFGFVCEDCSWVKPKKVVSGA